MFKVKLVNIWRHTLSFVLDQYAVLILSLGLESEAILFKHVRNQLYVVRILSPMCFFGLCHFGFDFCAAVFRQKTQDAGGKDFSCRHGYSDGRRYGVLCVFFILAVVRLSKILCGRQLSEGLDCKFGRSK